MLATLRIKNLALVDQVRIDFAPGLNVITGETGAGKSMLMGALALLLGARADKTIIRSGEDACGAEGVFQLADTTEIDELLDAYGVPACEDNQLIIRRIVKASGSGQNLVNDAPVTLQVMKQLGDLLVELHGPHDHQSLLHQDSQLELLDAFAHTWNEREVYEEAWQTWRAIQEQIEEARRIDQEDIEQKIDFLKYQIEEIDQADLSIEEEAEIKTEHDRLGHAQEIQQFAGGVVQALSDGEGAAYESLVAARRQMDGLRTLLPESEEWNERLEGMITQLQELDTDIRAVVDDIEGDPARLLWLDERLAMYSKLKKKYGPDVVDVLTTLEESQLKLKQLESQGERIEALEKECAAAESEMKKHAVVLSTMRKDAAEELSIAIQKELQELGLGNGTMTVLFQESDPRQSGCDLIEFCFAPNLGEESRPLRAIASSGEISRVMLAIKSVLASHDRIPVLVFDEIDSNVGGEMAGAVGRKLKQVAENHQVLCITHFPQVAAVGRCHFAVAKQVEDGRTFSRVVQLDENSRVEELARMLGGRDLTSVTLKHAREMIEQGAQKHRCHR